MKKIALSTAAALALTSGFALTAGSASAATIFQDAENRVDLHGRLRMGYVVDDGDASFQNFGSRFGFRFSHKVDDGLAAFANTEFRFDADEVNRTAMQVRSTFFGVDVTGLGRIYAGNFDSIYYQQVSSLLDIVEHTGFRALNTGGRLARGDTLAFDSANFGGVRFGVQAKLQPEVVSQAGDVTQEEAVNVAGYVGYRQGPLNIVVGLDQENEDMGGAGEVLLGLRTDYKLSDALSIGGLLENRDEATHLGATARFDLGAVRLYGLVSHLDVDGDNDLQYMVGASYRFSRPMYVFAEYADSTDAEVGGLDRSIFSLGARYNF